jgi:Bacterial SH3 domain
MMVPLPPGWLCLQDCNLSGQLNQPVVVPFVLMHPDVGIALIDVAPIANPEAESVLRRRLEAARFDSIFPGFLPILHLRLDRADLPSTEAILRDAFAAMPPLSVPGGDGWVSVVRRALLPRDPSRAAAHPGGLLAAQRQPTPRPAGEPARPADRDFDMLHREVSARADAAAFDFDSAVPEHAARSTPPIIWIIMSGVGGLIAVLALFTLLNSGADAPDTASVEAASAPPAASVAPPPTAALPATTPPPAVAPPPAAVAPPPPAPAAMPAPAPGSVASTPRPPPVGAAPPPPSSTATAALPMPRPPAPPPSSAAPTPGPATASTAAGASAAPAPAQRPAPAATDRLPRVTVRQPANLRTGPDGQSNVLRVVPRGETLRVHNRAPNGWVQVGDAEPRGWLHTSRLGEIE